MTNGDLDYLGNLKRFKSIISEACFAFIFSNLTEDTIVNGSCPEILLFLCSENCSFYLDRGRVFSNHKLTGILLFCCFCMYIIRHISQYSKSYPKVLFPGEQRRGPILTVAFVGLFLSFLTLKLCVVGKDFSSLIWM